MNWKLYISKYDYGYQNKTRILLGTFEDWQEAYTRWITLILDFPHHEGIIEVVAEEWETKKEDQKKYEPIQNKIGG